MAHRNDPEVRIRRNASAANWRKNNPEKVKKLNSQSRVRKYFGISREEYDARLRSQNGLCASCGEPFIGTGKEPLAPALDHCHDTGKLREFTHNNCNKGLGFFNHSPAKLKKAAEYLERHI